MSSALSDQNIVTWVKVIIFSCLCGCLDESILVVFQSGTNLAYNKKCVQIILAIINVDSMPSFVSRPDFKAGLQGSDLHDYISHIERNIKMKNEMISIQKDL